MGVTERKLQQLKGVGDILARRFTEGGLDTFAKIVAAGEQGLRSIRGINPRAIPEILEQAGHLAEQAKDDKAAQITAMKQSVAQLREAVNSCASAAKERFADALKGKPGEKLTRVLVQTLDTLDQVEKKMHKRINKAGKSLVKASKRMEETAAEDLKGVRKGLKKTRKALKKVLA